MLAFSTFVLYSNPTLTLFMFTPWLYFEVEIAAQDELQEITMALLADVGYDSFVQNADSLLAYIPAELFDGAALDEALPEGASVLRAEPMPDVNWNEAWEANYPSVWVDDFCHIYPAYRSPDPAVRYNLMIQPRMSFGTGHHETTRSVIRLMQDLNFTDKSVMDLGCGTGILGILAERLGAAHVHMLDNDPQAVSNAEDNLTANTTTRTTVAVGTAENLTENRYDVIIANITRNILIEAAPYIHTALRQGGQVLLSGFFVDDIQPLMAVYSQYGFVVSKQTSENQWAALCLSRAV